MFHGKHWRLPRGPADARRYAVEGTGLFRWLLGLGAHRLDDPLQVLGRGELDDDLSLAAAELDLDPGLEQVGEAVGQAGEAGGGGHLGPGPGREPRAPGIGAERAQ